MKWVDIYLVIGCVNALVAVLRGIFDREAVLDTLIGVALYVLAWPVQVAYKVWTLIAHPWLTLTSPRYRQHQREVREMQERLRGND